MKKRKSILFKVTAVFTLLLITSTVMFSCKKDADTVGVIVVNDSTGNPVVGASVTVWQDTSVNTTTGAQSNIRMTKTSDSNGKAAFTFALEAYLNITAIKGTNTAVGFIRLQEHQTITQTVHF